MTATDASQYAIEGNRQRPQVHLRIGEKRLTSGSGGVHEHVDPTTGQVDAHIPLAGPPEVDAAVSNAHDAFESWRTTSPAQRRQLLLRLADLIEENGQEFIRRGALDNGTPISVSPRFVSDSVAWTRYYAGWADKLGGDLSSSLSDTGEISYTQPQPYGVIGVILTWNIPLFSLAMKLPALLAAGNTAVVKPSELTPFSAELFGDLLEQAGFPPGVVNIVPGAPQAGAALVEHPLVQKVTFTGGLETGRKIMRSCVEVMKPAVMELGGKSANIIFEDCNLQQAAEMGAFLSVGALSGQGCSFPTRMLVQRSVYDEAVQRVAAIAGSFTVGDPFDPTVVAGPVINDASAQRILTVIEQALTDGAGLVAGGHRRNLPGLLAGGSYVEPTVFADVAADSPLAQQEVFGPVLAIIPFDTEAEAISIANGTQYGLSSYIQTADLGRAHRVAEQLKAGEVLINGALNMAAHRPFGGIGMSGFGKEGGRRGIEEFYRVKSVGIAIG